ncbi:heme ABC transporter permease [Candidatus Nitrosacidococcus tergens]|uniref:Heme exporter protein C n=1 Tax=Candidatus Nitrosacidococcus tergens TaxID=553981 RepID=A0A7G1QAQ8_9GAMM|nr:heme ABC transporter permease [Candidatus Nitrosacidococcus tergens]CAB1276515.1 heme exporter subunit; membrane component of ABC superfamily [Candidatus Nitrosacidococcus tergens]
MHYLPFHRYYRHLASPKYFYIWANRLIPWLKRIGLLLTTVGLVWGLAIAPTDYQQGDSYRIIFIHVPSAWMSLFIYMIIASCGAIALIWRVKIAEIIASVSAPMGASFTFLALVTGSLWGKPMWGAWWVWDARLTSELVLLFLYLGYMALESAIEDPRQAARAAGILALVGIVDLPIIHYSVEWWNTLHQGPTVTKFGAPSIYWGMLIPLLIMAIAFMVYYAAFALFRTQSEILERERKSEWVKRIISS